MSKKLTKLINEDVVNNIQLLDVRCVSYRDVIQSFMEVHLLDETTKAIDSPVFKRYQEAYANAKAAFEKAKDAMINDALDKETQSKVTTWSLDYSTYTLTYVVEE